ncbi:hypothetical protein MSAN_01759100 [Mycena sanguinolenta]|uniref:F-box domain-containing protein n=1 Tax=Mycena sanguinolenta TaxID=230812 RepID=A0A8H6XXD5_9AGAR|nr:hypothetical protein MSAN_01759100 [Mycena sanguinolenta]
MSSESILRARIEKLALVIEYQKQILRDLEQRMSDARRELNATLDPVARLPVEISSDIFARCIPDSLRPNSSEAPILFLHICRIWRDIATSTPSLWTSISCDSVTDPAHLDIWLRRAQNHPLCISLHGNLNRDVVVAVQRHAHHVQVLKLESSCHLERMGLTLFPSLTKLTLFNTTANTMFPDYLDILRFAPALAECHFISVYQHVMVAGHQPVPFTHSSLRRLQLCDGKSANATILLNYLTLPALENLYISASGQLMPIHIASLLTRSLPPLQSLHAEGLPGMFHEFDQALRLVPNVTDLTPEIPRTNRRSL